MKIKVPVTYLVSTQNNQYNNKMYLRIIIPKLRIKNNAKYSLLMYKIRVSVRLL